jgi:hypothetical protein
MEKVYDQCHELGIPINKENGDPYALVTLKKKIRAYQTGGAATPNPKTAANPMVDDPLIRAYLDKTGISKPTGETEIPLSIIIAAHTNHRELGDSGLSEHLPNFLENKALASYLEEKGDKVLTPHTLIPLKYIWS